MLVKNYFSLDCCVFLCIFWLNVLVSVCFSLCCAILLMFCWSSECCAVQNGRILFEIGNVFVETRLNDTEETTTCASADLRSPSRCSLFPVLALFRMKHWTLLVVDHRTPQLYQRTPQLYQRTPQLNQRTPQLYQKDPTVNQEDPTGVFCLIAELSRRALGSYG